MVLLGIVGALLALLLPAVSAQAAGRSAEQILTVVAQECYKSNGTLVNPYAARDIQKAYREIQRIGASHQSCALAVTSRFVALHRKAHSASAGVIVKDCLRGGGALSRSYTVRSLRQAFTKLSRQIAAETRCPIGISSQFNARRPHGVRPLRPMARRSPAVLPKTAPTETVRYLANRLSAFSRGRTVDDQLPDWSVGFLLGSEPTLDPKQSRRLGVRGDLVMSVGPGEYCLALRVVQAAVAVQCTSAVPSSRSLPRARTVTPGGMTVWIPALVGMHDVREMPDGGPGRWKKIAMKGDAIELTRRKTPLLLSYLDAKNVRHYLDTSGSPG